MWDWSSLWSQGKTSQDDIITGVFDSIWNLGLKQESPYYRYYLDDAGAPVPPERYRNDKIIDEEKNEFVQYGGIFDILYEPDVIDNNEYYYLAPCGSWDILFHIALEIQGIDVKGVGLKSIYNLEFITKPISTIGNYNENGQVYMWGISMAIPESWISIINNKIYDPSTHMVVDPLSSPVEIPDYNSYENILVYKYFQSSGVMKTNDETSKELVIKWNTDSHPYWLSIERGYNMRGVSLFIILFLFSFIHVYK